MGAYLCPGPTPCADPYADPSAELLETSPSTMSLLKSAFSLSADHDPWLSTKSFFVGEACTFVATFLRGGCGSRVSFPAACWGYLKL